MRIATNLCMGALLALASPALGTPDKSHQWIAGWTTPAIGYEPNIRDALGRPLNNETVRQELEIQTSGHRVRVRFTNELSPEVLRIGGASILRLSSDGQPVPGSLRRLTFAGQAAVLIPSHAPIVSDPVDFSVNAGERLAISVYYPGESAPPAHAQMADVSPGDASGKETLANAFRARVPGLVTGIEVTGSSASQVVVTFGDSITEGAGASRAMSWPDQLSRLLRTNPAASCWAVANQGISGNRLLNQGRGPNALSRFDRDVLAVPGATHVVILEGINDIGKVRDPAQDQPSAERLIGAYEQLIDRAHARGIKVIMGTLLPYVGAAYADEAGEMRRRKVNDWIRSNAPRFDGLIDFDRVMDDRTHPGVMRPDEHIGDFLHPNDKGYGAMASSALSVMIDQGCR